MFMTLLVNILWMLFMLFFGVLCFANARGYRSELEAASVPDAE